MTRVTAPIATTRRSVRVRGVVQGVGFRPFVHHLAEELGLEGHVGNDTDGVFVEVEGFPEAVDEFERRGSATTRRRSRASSASSRPSSTPAA